MTLTHDAEDGPHATTAPSSSRVATPATPHAGLLVGLERYGLLILFAIILIVFSITARDFAQLSNFRIVLGSQAPLGILAIASIVPLACGQFDLSVAAILGTCAITLGACLSDFHLPLAVGILITLAAGATIGMVNGLFVAKIGVNAFIVTLAMTTFLQGLVQWYTGGEAISTGISQRLVDASTGNILGVPRGVFWLVPVALIAWYVHAQTPFGRYITSIGSSSSAARLVGIPVSRYTLSSFVISGTLSALAGILTVGQSGVADPGVAQGGILLPALAAAFLGSSAFQPGRFNVPGTILAIYFVAFSVSGLEFLGVASWVRDVFNGVTLAGAVTVTTLLARRSRREE